MDRKNYLCIEAPDTEATIDFLGTHGVVVKAKIEMFKGKPRIYIIATACNDHATILGEILEYIPESEKQ